MKNKIKEHVDGNIGTIHLFGWIGVFITIATFWFTCQSKVDARIDERIDMSPKLQSIEEENRTMHMNLKRMMSEFDIEYIE